MPVMLEAPPVREPREDLATAPADHARRASGGGDGEPDGRGGSGDDGQRNWPIGLAIVTIIALAALLTYLGMQTQIWANMAGSQLPGA